MEKIESYETPEKDKKIIAKWKKFYSEANAALTKSGLADLWDIYEKINNNNWKLSENDKREHGSDIYIPEAASQFYSVLVFILGSYIADESQYLHVEAEASLDDTVNQNSLENQRFVERAIQRYRDAARFDDFLYDWCWDWMETGTGIMMVDWYRREKAAPIKSGLEIPPTMGIEQQQPQVIDEGPVFYSWSPLSVRWDSQNAHVQDKDYIIFTRKVSHRFCKEQFKKGIWIKKQEKYLYAISKVSEMEKLNITSDKADEIGDQCEAEKKELPDFDLRICLSPQGVIEVLNGKLIVRKAIGADNPHIYDGKFIYPVFVQRWKRCPRESYGKGFFADIKDLQYLINVIWNKYLERLALATAPPLTTDGAVEEPDKKNFRLAPRQLLEGKNIREIIIDPQTGETFSIISGARGFMMDKTSALDKVRAMLPMHKELASVGMQRSQVAMNLFGLQSGDLKRGIAEVWEFVIKMMQKYQANPIPHLMENDRGEKESMPIRRDQIVGNYSVKVTVDPNSEKRNLAAEQMRKLFETAGQHPWVDEKEILRNILEVQRTKNRDKIILDPEAQMMRMVQDQMVQIAAQNLLQKIQAGMASQGMPGQPGGMPGEGQMPMAPLGGQMGMQPQGAPGGMQGIDSEVDMARVYAPPDEDQRAITEAVNEGI